MNGWIYACLAVGLLLLATPAGALMPDDITLSTDKIWLTAGNGGTSTVTVNVTNGSGAEPVPGAAVYLAVDAAYGSISPARVVTGSNGTATATFRHGTRSGTATITATVSDEELVVPLTRSVEQQIDHAAPHKIANLWYESEVTAGETTDITVRMVDRYGNVVDNQNVAEKVTFRVGQIEGGTGATFVANGTDEVAVPVDAVGNATATLRLDTVAGVNMVSIFYPPKPAKPAMSDMISITGVGGLPVDITSEVSPESGSVSADGKTKISFTYTLFDEYGNPAAGQGLWVNATLKRQQKEEEQSRLLTTNSAGQVMITYGPEDSVGMANITATSAVNASVTNTTRIVFTSTDAVDMLLSASPQSMPSLDVPGSGPAELRAKVVDVRGNPVKDEKVTFEIVSNSFAPYNQTEPPKLKGESVIANATTNDDGYAIVEFWPGTFTTDRNDSSWRGNATGTAVVQATWKNKTGVPVNQDISLTWMNYPYLSVETEVSPEDSGGGRYRRRHDPAQR